MLREQEGKKATSKGKSESSRDWLRKVARARKAKTGEQVGRRVLGDEVEEAEMPALDDEEMFYWGAWLFCDHYRQSGFGVSPVELPCILAYCDLMTLEAGETWDVIYFVTQLDSHYRQKIHERQEKKEAIGKGTVEVKGLTPGAPPSRPPAPSLQKRK